MTTFKDTDNKTIQQMENEISTFWKDHKIFEKSVENRSSNNQYVFYDGPPFISGLPHYGHLLGSIAKDIIPRYWTMKGKRVERVWGWDAHGLTVENKVQKKLDIKNRRDIEAFGLEAFTKACYEYTSQTSAEWNWYVDKIGRWVDIDNAYRTTDQNYMESVMWAFKKLYDKGMIYEGVRTSLYCPTCGTPVSNFEISMDNSYKDVEDPAVTIKFKVTTEGVYKDSYILAWTTTPWTLPSNRALVVAPDATYVQVTLEETPNETIILAKPRIDATLGTKPHKIINEFKGSDLVGLSYEPLYNFYVTNDKDFKVYSFENMVTMEEGVGIVHSAPGFGEIDTEMGQHYGLSMTLAIDDDGNVKDSTTPNIENPYKGMFYKKSNKFIRENLTTRGLMFNDGTIVHRFPYHDRCDTLLIHRAQNSWFVNIKDLKPSMLKNNENINWVPSHLKDGQFASVIENAPDWCISRNRYWATPMPVWRAEDGDTLVLGSIKEIEELAGKKVADLHRPYIDEITIQKDGKTYKRIPEVLDSWFEAGSMPYAQMHYPFENEAKFDANFPGDYIVEYIAQVRAWFNVMHRLSVALFGKNSFKNVISTGTLAGNDGRKMSKTYGNYTDPKEILETIGGDALRLYLMNSPLMLGENANFDETELKTKLRNVLNPLWNSAKFFLMYAKNTNWNYKNAVVSEDVLDKWIIARLKTVKKEFSENIEKYTTPNAIKPLEDFVDDLSRWYVRRSRDRISSGDNQALSTLYFVLVEFSKIAAPAIPFMTEKMYQDLVVAVDTTTIESVHLCDYPVIEELTETELQILNEMSLTREIVSTALSVRVEKGLKVRQPLAALYVKSKKGEILEFYKDLIEDEVNVKKVEAVTEEILNVVSIDTAELVIYLDITVTEELRIEGLARDMIRKMQDLRKEKGLSVADKITATCEDTEDNRKVIEMFGTEIKAKIMAQDLTYSTISGINLVQ